MSCRIKTTHYLLVFYLTLLGCSSAPSVFAEAPNNEAEVVAIELEADTILKQMSDYLASIQKFEMEADVSLESVLDSGQKIMQNFSNKVVVKRPNKLFSSRIGTEAEQRFFYDGKLFTLYNPQDDVYASVGAPDTISKTLDFAQEQFNFTAPGIDLLHNNIHERLSNELLSGFYVGKAMIDGVDCHHLAFRNTEVDWQIWVAVGDKPLPKKYVITSRWITGAPQYSTTMSWNLTPDSLDNIFTFVAPKDSKKVEVKDAISQP